MRTRVTSSHHIGDTVRIWNVSSGKMEKSLREHTEIITSVVWMHQYGGANGSVIGGAGGSKPSSASNHGNANSTFSAASSFGNDNSEEGGFFTSSLDKTIKYWRNYSVVATYTEHNGEVASC